MPCLKEEKDCVEKSGKIKLRIAHSSVNNWNAISRICQVFMEDSAFEVTLIVSVVNFEEKALQQAKKIGCNYIVWEKYHIERDKPDILILTNMGDRLVTEGISCRAYVKLLIVIPMQLVRYDKDSVASFWEFVEKGYGRHRPDYYIFDSFLFNEIKQSPYYSEYIIEMGNIKFDGIFQAIQNKKYSVYWDKLKGKTIVLCASCHGVYNKIITPFVTFDLYAKTIFEYMYNHQDMGLIFRPHSVFVQEMISSGFWSENDVLQLKKYCENSSNIVFDDSDTYEAAFSVADGILTDAYCGIICSALPTLKPICATYRTPQDSPSYRNLLDVCYSVYEDQDITSFFEKMRNKQDPMLDIRKSVCKEYVKHFDGKNGLRLKKFIKDKYFEMENKRELREK